MQHRMEEGHARRLVELDGGRTARRDPSDDGALATLQAAGIDLCRLDEVLRHLGDDGLDPGVAARRFRGTEVFHQC